MAATACFVLSAHVILESNVFFARSIGKGSLSLQMTIIIYLPNEINKNKTTLVCIVTMHFSKGFAFELKYQNTSIRHLQ